jgi:hypothetical protein
MACFKKPHGIAAFPAHGPWALFCGEVWTVNLNHGGRTRGDFVEASARSNALGQLLHARSTLARFDKCEGAQRRYPFSLLKITPAERIGSRAGGGS